MHSSSSDIVKVETPAPFSPTVSKVFFAFVVCSVILVYIGSVFMTYVVLSDIIFQVLHLFVLLAVLYEPNQDPSTFRLDVMKLIAQFCWVLYSYSVISLIIMVVAKQFVSFFKTMWTTLSMENVIAKFSKITHNPNINQTHFKILMGLFSVYFIGTVGFCGYEMSVRKGIKYAAFGFMLMAVPILFGFFQIILESWRIAVLIIKGDFVAEKHQPIELLPDFPFPTDLIDPANLRNHEEVMLFLRDPHTNIYLRKSGLMKKLFGFLHVVALGVGVYLRIHFMKTDSQNYSWIGMITVGFYIVCIPFTIFCNLLSPFRPAQYFSDKGNLRMVFFAVYGIYVFILFILIGLSSFVLMWERPEEKYRFKFYTDSTLMKSNWTLATSSATTCNIDIKGMTFSQLSALPMLTYFSEDSADMTDPIQSDIIEHNRKVILTMAFASLRERKVTEINYKHLRDGIHIRDGKIHIFVINGLRRPVDWVMLFEQYVQYNYFAILKALIPFYEVVYNILRVSLLSANKYFALMTNCQTLTAQKARDIKYDVYYNAIPKNRTTYTNIAIGHLTGGYFSKYLGSLKRKVITGMGFDSLTFQGTELEIDESDLPLFGMTLNVYGNGSIYSASELRTKNNFERNGYGHFDPPDAVESFCHSVAMCSNDRYEIDFCNTILNNQFDSIMQGYNRTRTTDDRQDFIGVITNKDNEE